MKNKNSLVLTIIAIVTILVTVIGATFAYFASTVNEGTGSALTTVVDENDVFFTATGSNATMEITADKMTQHASKDGVIVAGDSSDSIMNVTLTTGTEGSIACNYNIYFQWESNSNAYLTKTSGATKEFTAQLALTDPNGNGSAGTNKFANETQLTDVVTTVNKTLVVEGASIVANAAQSGSQSWTPTIKFYNLQLNQTDLAGKTFKGKFTIDDVECGAAIIIDPNSLSGKVFAKVSNSDYTSSQDQSIYRVVREEVEYEGETLDAGVRYEGLDPDNYITFNGNEEWRIIGVFEGSTIGLEPGKQYTKIIRGTSIGDYAWDCDDQNGDGNCYDESESDWENATLNAYLNGEYLNGLSDASKIAKYNGKYSTWYLRGTNNDTNLYTPDWFITERISGQAGYKNGMQHGAKAEIQAAIGLMYPSDYGYAAYGTECDNKSSMTLYNYGTKDYDGYDYLVSGCVTANYLATDLLNNNGLEWLISHGDASAAIFYICGPEGGRVRSWLAYIFDPMMVRPTLYLEANVTATGTGTKLDPYVLN